MAEKKERIDVLLVEKGHFDTREKAKRAVMAGLVFAKDVRVDKPGEKVLLSTDIRVKGNPLPYVSRGGLKLEKAIKEFSLDLTDKVLLDVGSSTGGFTDCALQNGVTHSYAVDVGYNQLAWKLRQDERVTVMERTNFRYVTKADLKGMMPSFATIDVSFISLTLILPVLKLLLVDGSKVVALVKPQFEAGRGQVGKKGIVRESSIHEGVLQKISDHAKEQGYIVEGATFSPITGGEGNIEFLLLLGWYGAEEKRDAVQLDFKKIVQSAHNTF